jgi:hypothetical protein
MSEHAAKQLEKMTPHAAECFGIIYGDASEEGAKVLCEAYQTIIKRIEGGLHIKRESVFTDEDGNEVPTVLAGTDTDNGIVIIYDAFFKKAEGDEKGLNARSTVLMHEIGHIVGLEGDAEIKSYESAECLKNFTLLVCEIVTSRQTNQKPPKNPNSSAKTENCPTTPTTTPQEPQEAKADSSLLKTQGVAAEAKMMNLKKTKMQMCRRTPKK